MGDANRRTGGHAKGTGKPAGADIATAPSPLLVLVLLSVIVVGVTLFAHWPALSARALFFDDNQYLTDNQLVQHPSWASTGRFFREVLEPSTVGGYYQPLPMISLMLDVAMGGRPDNLRVFHQTSLALHAMNTLLVIVLVYLVFGKPWVAALVGLIFGVHPMTVESIAWISERKTLLATFFSLWCLIAYVGYTRGRDWRLYVACLVLYVLALMSKPTSTPLPVVMLLMDYWPLRRLDKRAVIEKLPFLAIGALSGAITMISQARTARLDVGAQYPAWSIPLILCHNIVFYLYKIVWPARLAPFYPFPEPLAISNAMVLAGVIGTAILVAALIVSLRWTRAFLAGWLMFFVAILPTMGVLSFTFAIASDRFVYLPAIGLLLIVAWLLNRAWSGGPTRRGIALTLTGVAACACIALTRAQLVHWQDTLGLYDYVLQSAPNSPYVYNNRGAVYARMGQMAHAIQDCTRVIELKPDSAEAYTNRGAAYAQLNDYAAAISDCSRAIELRPNYANAWYNRGKALERRGEFKLAIRDYTRAIELKPDFAEAYNNRGATHGRSEQYDLAVQDLTRAIELNPQYADAYQNRAMAYGLLKQYDKAWADVNACRRLGREPNVHVMALLAAAADKSE